MQFNVSRNRCCFRRQYSRHLLSWNTGSFSWNWSKSNCKIIAFFCYSEFKKLSALGICRVKVQLLILTLEYNVFFLKKSNKNMAEKNFVYLSKMSSRNTSFSGEDIHSNNLIMMWPICYEIGEYITFLNRVIRLWSQGISVHKNRWGC